VATGNRTVALTDNVWTIANYASHDRAYRCVLWMSSFTHTDASMNRTTTVAELLISCVYDADGGPRLVADTGQKPVGNWPKAAVKRVDQKRRGKTGCSRSVEQCRSPAPCEGRSAVDSVTLRVRYRWV